KIVCIGLNYRDHARETGQEVPKEPVIFFKATSSICGPNDDVVIPKGGTKVDWEVELSVVLGRRAAYVERDEALGYVAGYVLHNDYSERAFQLERGGQRPPRYLAAGDEVELGIDGLGFARQRVRAYDKGLAVRDSGLGTP